jgi:hypothetical protein
MQISVATTINPIANAAAVKKANISLKYNRCMSFLCRIHGSHGYRMVRVNDFPSDVSLPAGSMAMLHIIPENKINTLRQLLKE